MEVREATPDDLPAVATVLDAALLERDDLPGAVESGQVLVATADGRILGALVLRPAAAAPRWTRERGADAHVEAIAVRRRRRGQGIGSTLVARALDRAGTVTAAFDHDVRPFYESLGFDVEAAGGRLRGVLSADE